MQILWTMTFQNKRNRKRETPLIGYAIRIMRKISIHETASLLPYVFVYVMGFNQYNRFLDLKNDQRLKVQFND